MDLVQRLTKEGSSLSKYNGEKVPILKGSTRESTLHGTPEGGNGYSITGEDFKNVNKQYQSYDTSPNKTLPQSSLLDLDGTFNTSNPGFIKINNTFEPGKKYEQTLPEETPISRVQPTRKS